MSLAVFESGFLRSVATLDVESQKKCLQAVFWFEHHLASEDRQKRSDPLELSPRRRLRSVNASKTLRVVYVVVDKSTRQWVWAGEEWDLDLVAAKLDDDKDDEPETLDVKTLLSWLKDAIISSEKVIPGDRNGQNGHASVSEVAEVIASIATVTQPVAYQASGAEVDDCSSRRPTRSLST